MVDGQAWTDPAADRMVARRGCLNERSTVARADLHLLTRPLRMRKTGGPIGAARRMMRTALGTWRIGALTRLNLIENQRGVLASPGELGPTGPRSSFFWPEVASLELELPDFGGVALEPAGVDGVAEPEPRSVALAG